VRARSGQRRPHSEGHTVELIILFGFCALAASFLIAAAV
jgi:hypothetical protein